MSNNDAQVYPRKVYPEDIMDQFIKLTNVYDDEDNKLLAEVYLVSLFLLANLPQKNQLTDLLPAIS